MIRVVASLVAALVAAVHPGHYHAPLSAELALAQRRYVAHEHATKLEAERRAASEALVSLDPTRWPDWPLWHCTALHESGGVFWTNEAGPFSGPFDIARTTWQAFGGPYARRWPDAATAPPWAQVLGARLVRAAVGSSQWGGLHACGG